MRMSGCFLHGQIQEVRAITVDDEALYAVTNCNAVLRRRHRDGCTTFLNLEKDPVYTFGAEQKLRDLIIRDKQLIAVGEDGQIYELDLRDFDRDLIGGP